MSGSMVSKLFGYFEGNRCSLEAVSSGEKKKATCFSLVVKYWLMWGFRYVRN